jgi:glycosyltransferase involved in cell wall biosynthesis
MSSQDPLIDVNQIESEIAARVQRKNCKKEDIDVLRPVPEYAASRPKEQSLGLAVVIRFFKKVIRGILLFLSAIKFDFNRRRHRLEINQLLPAFNYGDAIGNAAINIQKVLRQAGIKSTIYAEYIHPKMTFRAKPSCLCPKKKPIIYHMAIGSKLSNQIPRFQSLKIMNYHNITPSRFFEDYNEMTAQLCKEGQEQLKFLSDKIDLAVADSDYNRKELDDLGYVNTFASPIILHFEDYEQPCEPSLLDRLRANGQVTNLLFVGRIAPNKKQEDIIKVFYYYKKYINPDSCLYLVGSYKGMETYYRSLLDMIAKLDLKDVFFTGHVSFRELLSYYRAADLFLCMSEHEGFCIPLVEAMYFNIPIIAYDSSAVSETLGNAGLLVQDKDYPAIAELIDITLNSELIRRRLKQNSADRIKDLSTENAEKSFLSAIQSILQ